ncbi:hypothetical protein [Streptomyces sp. NPDC002386]
MPAARLRSPECLARATVALLGLVVADALDAAAAVLAVLVVLKLTRMERDRALAGPGFVMTLG